MEQRPECVCGHMVGDTGEEDIEDVRDKNSFSDQFPEKEGIKL